MKKYGNFKNQLRWISDKAGSVSSEAFMEFTVPSGKLRYSPMFCEILGSSGEPLPVDYKTLLARVHPRERDRFRVAVHSLIEGKIPLYEMEFRLRHSNGFYLWVKMRIKFYYSLLRRKRIAGSLIDVSDFRITHNQLMHATQFDQLTGLPNRTFFLDSLRKLPATHKSLTAVLYIDLDRFKYVNDSLGHETGDRFIKKIAKRLQVYEGPGDVISRLGGDEFGILVRNARDVRFIREVAEGLLKIISLPLILDGHKIYPAASIGILIIESQDLEAETALKKAEAAVYRAKELGKNRFIIYQQEMNPGTDNLLQMETSLRLALDKEEFGLYYQPVVSLETGMTVGFEALVRWMRPGHGLIQPGGFINHAEETGLIVPLGEWVLNEACRQHQEWKTAGFEGLHMAVNVSAYQFEQRKMLAVVNRALRENGMEAKELSIEVTESVVMKDVDYSRQILQDLNKLGSNILIDDFGTGYSSFMYLKRFPFTILKIDRFFIKDLETDPESASIVKAIIAVAHNMKMKVIAEGVETEQQLCFLQKNNCDFIQGFYVSKPVPSSKAVHLLGKKLIKECSI